MPHPALLNDGVAVGAQTCAQKNILNVAKPARLTVNEVHAFTGSIEPALDHNFMGSGRAMGAVPIAVAISIAVGQLRQR